MLTPQTPLQLRLIFWVYLFVMVALLVAYVFEIICWCVHAQQGEQDAPSFATKFACSTTHRACMM